MNWKVFQLSLFTLKFSLCLWFMGQLKMLWLNLVLNRIFYWFSFCPLTHSLTELWMPARTKMRKRIFFFCWNNDDDDELKEKRFPHFHRMVLLENLNRRWNIFRAHMRTELGYGCCSWAFPKSPSHSHLILCETLWHCWKLCA